MSSKVISSERAATLNEESSLVLAELRARAATQRLLNIMAALGIAACLFISGYLWADHQSRVAEIANLHRQLVVVCTTVLDGNFTDQDRDVCLRAMSGAEEDR